MLNSLDLLKMRTIEWDYSNHTLRMIDQRLLPGELRYLCLENVDQVAEAIRSMAVRGAPAIGATAAFGLALAAQKSPASDILDLQRDLQLAIRKLLSTRPTAANLKWALQRVLKIAQSESEWDVAQIRFAVLAEAQKIADEDVKTNQQIAQFGATLIDDGDTIIHHCNTGALATVDWGTALGVIRYAHEEGKKIHVLVDETRPRLQGARLTAWELEQYHISYEIITDNAAGYFLRSGKAQKVFFGADRMASNGDVANKIGTYMLALAANDNQVPAYCALPLSTIDLSLTDGSKIPIEERNPTEVLQLQIDGLPVVPSGAKAKNPAFDVTPASLITAVITEIGIIYPPFSENLHRALYGK